MPSRKQWVFAPDSGGCKIPEVVKQDVVKRIERIAKRRYAGHYARLDIRFRGQFCYINAYREPVPVKNWPPKDWPETRTEYLERLRNTPVHLCRLRYFGDDRWSFGFFTYSHEKYELSVFPDGEFFGKPEAAFQIAADVYCLISPPGGHCA